MFSKLLRYDLKATFKYWWIAAVSSFLLSLLGGVCMQITEVEHTQYHTIQVMALVLLILVWVALFLFLALSEILIYVRFYKHLFTDEGYLTFTLPVKKTTIFNSKLLSGIIVSIVSVAVFFVDIFAMYSIGAPDEVYDKFMWIEIGDTIKEFFTQTGGYSVVYLLEILLLLFVLSVLTVLIVYCAITIASVIARKHKVLCAIGIYYGYSVVIAIVIGLSTTFGLYRVVDLISLHSESEIYLIYAFVFLLLLTFCTALTGAIYCFVNWLLERKLNLE